MILKLRAHPSSIRAAVLKHEDPARIVRVLNHASGWSRCLVSITKPDPQIAQLEFVFQGRPDSQPILRTCLDGVVPEVFDCDELIVAEEGLRGRLVNPREVFIDGASFLELSLTTESLHLPANTASLTLLNYHRPFALPSLTSVENVVERLCLDTLMRCGHPGAW